MRNEGIFLKVVLKSIQSIQVILNNSGSKQYKMNLSVNIQANGWSNRKLVIFLFFLIGIHSMQGWTATTRHGVTRKKAQKRLQDKENLFGKNLQLKDVC